jgi:hypothetical protein
MPPGPGGFRDPGLGGWGLVGARLQGPSGEVPGPGPLFQAASSGRVLLGPGPCVLALRLAVPCHPPSGCRRRRLLPPSPAPKTRLARAVGGSRRSLHPRSDPETRAVRAPCVASWKGALSPSSHSDHTLQWAPAARGSWPPRCICRPRAPRAWTLSAPTLGCGSVIGAAPVPVIGGFWRDGHCAAPVPDKAKGLLPVPVLLLRALYDYNMPSEREPPAGEVLCAPDAPCSGDTTSQHTETSAAGNGDALPSAQWQPAPPCRGKAP